MGLLPEFICKGFLKKLDARYKDAAVLRQALGALGGLPAWPAGNLADLGEARGAFTKAEADHLRNDWFKAWWPNAQPVEPIIREGLITAMKVAIHKPGEVEEDEWEEREEPLPIDFYWVCHPGHSKASPEQSSTAPPSSPDDRVEVTVSWSDHQVTVIIHTPDARRGQGTVPEPMFVVNRDHEGEVIPIRITTDAE